MVINVFFAPNSYGGATIVAEEVSRRLIADHGARVSAISAMSRGDLPDYATVRTEARGVAHTMINLPGGRTYTQRYVNPDVASRVAEIVRAAGPDMVHVHCVQDLGADLIPAIRALGVPVVLSLHDYWWICERQFMIRRDERWCGERPVGAVACRGCADNHPQAMTRACRLAAIAAEANIVTCPSETARRIYVESGFLAERLTVWENGIRPPSHGFAAQQARRRAAGGKRTFAFVGGPSVIKGWPLLLDAFDGLDRDDFRVLLVDGSLDGSWYRGRDLSRLPGDWQVVRRYAQDTADAFWAEVDTLLFLSQWKETFGLTVREALSRGVRVIQTDAGGASDHAGGDRVRCIPMDATADDLRAVIQAELNMPDRGCRPLRVRSYAEQAAELLRLILPRLPEAELHGGPVRQIGRATRTSDGGIEVPASLE